MADLITKYKTKSYRTIEWDLRKQGTPEEMIAATLSALRQARSDAKRDKLRTRRIDTAWAEIIEALQHERRIVRSMLRYKTAEPAPERDDFTNQYAYILNELYAKLAKRRKERIPPEHSHWVDFIPTRVRDAFEEAASSIPVRSRAKVKQPFERRLPLPLYDKRKARLLRSTRSELHTMQDKGNTDAVDLLEKAIDLIHDIPEGHHVPNTWREVIDAADVG